MKTIKLIDLLNKMARNEKTPEKIIFKDKIFDHNGMGSKNYFCKEEQKTLEELFVFEELNVEVEIIEANEIEKIIFFEDDKAIVTIVNKINEIIDHINKKDSK